MENKGLGEFEELVLLAVCIMEGDAYGISVKKEVEKHSGRSILLGAVHITLYRLQDKGFLQSKLGGNTFYCAIYGKSKGGWGTKIHRRL